ncbi:hypothetical protein LFZ3_05725 [Salmonella enterica subsp. enterica serovar Bergen str. ST350]|nr:hypothetical protein LFZ3_05725 [Salmonella enterica subsp. enterica serovar Bergen str. ST350]
MNGSGPGGVKSISPGSTFAPGSGFTGSPLSTPAEPWTIGPPFAVISFWRAAGFPLTFHSFHYF